MKEEDEENSKLQYNYIIAKTVMRNIKYSIKKDYS